MQSNSNLRTMSQCQPRAEQAAAAAGLTVASAGTQGARDGDHRDRDSTYAVCRLRNDLNFIIVTIKTSKINFMTFHRTATSSAHHRDRRPGYGKARATLSSEPLTVHPQMSRSHTVAPIQ